MGSGGKRRHRQAGPDEDDDQNRDSTHGRSARSEDSKEDLLKCSHAASSVLESKVRKAIKPAYVRIGGLCNECNRLKLPPDSTTSPSYLMCLACGLQFCKAHLQDHFKAQRNGPQHCIALDLSDWALSCNSCGPNLSPDSSKRLRDVYEFVKRSKINKKKSVSSHVAATSAAHHNSISSSSSSTQLPKVRGLTNLGNTCFLTLLCNLHSQKGAPFRTGKILGGDVLSLQLEDAGPLTISLAAFLKGKYRH
ncbi:Ubiquitinyl hydrolase 1 [Caligus rogercresseyi]|uniref:Ubiquitinyl hydrolase 1 n=1 Tax=Caligus rogercresseyi TaxID=217165 RepID=A0A7T8JYH9_CALRO|nr:Ubiquitinyl hydrolase 1 [Caligus rogercresseyi]